MYIWLLQRKRRKRRVNVKCGSRHKNREMNGNRVLLHKNGKMLSIAICMCRERERERERERKY